MNILHINSYYSTSKFYKNLFDAQVKKGNHIEVFVPISTTYKKDKFDYGQYTRFRRNFREIDRILFFTKEGKIVKDVINTYKPLDLDIVHAHSLFVNGYVAMKLKKKYGIPFIVAVRNTDVNLFFKRMIHLRSVGISILKSADRIIFLSKSYQHHFIKKYVPTDLQEILNKKAAIIPNGIDDFWYKNSSNKNYKPNKKIKLLQVGDIDRNKNIVTTIEAVSILKRNGFDVVLNAVGKIKDKKTYKDLTKSDFVKYLGFKSKEDLIKIYKDNSIFILPSIYESFGLVYAEAMSQGLPIIYTKGQGFDQQFNEGEVGFRVYAKDAEKIAQSIIKILDDYEGMSRRAREKSNKFRWHFIEKQYYNIYKGVIR